MKRYKFSPEITHALDRFKSCLKAANLNQNTVRQHSNYAGIFLEWLEEQGLKKTEARYRDIIAFIRALQSENYSTRFINRILLAVRYYYKCQKAEINPAMGIHLRGQAKTVPGSIVDHKEILRTYERYQGLDNRTKRNRIILGLMIYQAITTEEVKKLEPRHIKLKEGKIYLPGGKHSNARVLDLHASQLLEIQEYLQKVRPEIQKDITAVRAARKPDKIDWKAVDEQLFFSENGSGRIKSSLYHLFRHVKKLNPAISSAKVIRQSVIVHWLKHRGIRQVQYMAGHRYVSSTERYRAYDEEELTEALQLYHPLK